MDHNGVSITGDMEGRERRVCSYLESLENPDSLFQFQDSFNSLYLVSEILYAHHGPVQ